MKFEIYKTEHGEYAWRLKARNGRIIADSAESYKQKSKVTEQINKIRLGAPHAKVSELVDVTR